MKIAVLEMAEKRLAWADRRQQVLAQNIANANTPKFQSRDVLPFAAIIARHGDVEMLQTQPNHLAPPAGAGAGMAPIARPRERAPDGNAVSLDEELTKVADTETAQELVTGVYKKYLGLFRMALGRS